MKLIQIGTIILLGSTAFAACGGDGDGGTGGTGNTGAVGSGNTGNVGTGNTGNTNSGGSSGSGGGLGTGGGGGGACTAVVAGPLADPVMFFGGTSTQATGAAAVSTAVTGGSQLADTDGVSDPDDDPLTYSNNPWASISYALGAEGACADISALESITVTVTSEQAATMRIGISTSATTPVSEGGTCTADCNNHWVLHETFTAGETKNLTLPADGVGLEGSWETGGAPFTPNNVLQIVVGIQPTDSDVSATIPAFDVTLSNISAQ